LRFQNLITLSVAESPVVLLIRRQKMQNCSLCTKKTSGQTFFLLGRGLVDSILEVVQFLQYGKVQGENTTNDRPPLPFDIEKSALKKALSFLFHRFYRHHPFRNPIVLQKII